MNRLTVTANAGTAACEPAIFLPVTSLHVSVPRRSAPGLGIVPDPDDGTGLRRYSVVHLASGLAVFGCVTSRCSIHVQQAAGLLHVTGIDWQQPAATLTTTANLGPVRRRVLDTFGLCFDPETARATPCLGEWFGTGAVE